jgi:hypothetical protein
MRASPARLVLSVVATALAAGSLVTLALASHPGVRDGNDTKGTMDASLVDKHGGERPRWTVRTFASWRVAEIFDSGLALVRLDTFGSPRYDYYALVRSDGIKLRASLWRDRATKRDYLMRRLKVGRNDKRSLTVRVPLRRVHFGERRLTYHWQVETLFTGDVCPNVCFDFVPDSGGMQELVPFPRRTQTPTPTPTQTATPLPTISG